MYKTKICDVDISVGDVLEDKCGNICTVYKISMTRVGAIVEFYWISRRGIFYADCTIARNFQTVFKKKVKI